MLNKNGSHSLNVHEEDRFPSTAETPASDYDFDSEGRLQMQFVFSDLVPIAAPALPPVSAPRKRRRRHSDFGFTQPSLFGPDDLNTLNDDAADSVAAVQNVVTPTVAPAANVSVVEAEPEYETTLTADVMANIQKFVKHKIRREPTHCSYDDLFQIAYAAYLKVEKSFRKHNDPEIGWSYKKFKNYTLRAIQNDIYDELQASTTILSTSSYYVKWHGTLSRELARGMTEEEIAAKHHLTVHSVHEILTASSGEMAFTEGFDDDGIDSRSGVSTAAANSVRCAVAEADQSSRQDNASRTETVDAVHEAINRLDADDRRILNYLLNTDFESGSSTRKKTVASLAKEFGCTASEMNSRIAAAYANLRDMLPARIAKCVR